MSCQDDLEHVHTEKNNRNNAAAERARAFESMRDADGERGVARAGRANCGKSNPIGEMFGECSDQQDTLDKAESKYDGAKGGYNKANEALNEAQGWLDLAEEIYCECLRDQLPPIGDFYLETDTPIV